MPDHPIEGLMKTTMDSLKEMIDVNTIVGDPVKVNEDSIIIPISRVSVGFASGGAEYKKDEQKTEITGKFPFGGGSGAGMSVQPVAFLVISKEQIKLLPVNQANSLERIFDNIPEFINELKEIFKKDSSKTRQEEGFNAT